MYLNSKFRIVRKALLAPIALAFATSFSAVPAVAQDKISCVFPFWFGFAPVFVA